MGEQITHNPFKELPSSGKDLEAHLLKLKITDCAVDVSSLLPFIDLPQYIQSNGLEDLGNAQSIATQKDINREERGSWAHIQHSPLRLVTPSMFSVGKTTYDGDTGIISQSVTPDMYITENHYPVAFVHSHPTPDTFSGADIYLAVGVDQPVKPIVTIAATPQYNYMLLRTQDAKEMTIDGVREGVRVYQNVWWQEGITYSDRLVKTMYEDPEKFDELLETFGGDAHDFFINAAIVQEFADENRVGFYFSKKDGNYQLLSQTRIRVLMEEIFVGTPAHTQA